MLGQAGVLTPGKLHGDCLVGVQFVGDMWDLSHVCWAGSVCFCMQHLGV